jgi:hypothetical protein
MQFDQLKRRDFITLLCGAAAWPLTARAQQPTMPLVGWLGSGLSKLANYSANGLIMTISPEFDPHAHIDRRQLHPE